MCQDNSATEAKANTCYKALLAVQRANSKTENQNSVFWNSPLGNEVGGQGLRKQGRTITSSPAHRAAGAWLTPHRNLQKRSGAARLADFDFSVWPPPFNLVQ